VCPTSSPRARDAEYSTAENREAIVHSIALVLLPPDERDIQAGIERQLMPHLFDEENPEKKSHLDRWSYGIGDIGPPTITAELGLGDNEWAGNVCRVRQLPADYTPAALVVPAGEWLDLWDHGWSGSDPETPHNKTALTSWKLVVRGVLDGHSEWLAVEVDAHR
jgi:hypothetical protein